MLIVINPRPFMSGSPGLCSCRSMRHSSQPGAGNRTFLMSQNRTLLKSSDIQIVDNLSYVKSSSVQENHSMG
ncbi:hypothetical protein G3A39_18275 [Paraburkholderia aspalathi]|uniref:hypothetical protein n=1 Tax=Paraburkholderia nemoris TaxID=2793076 RepID=UPI00190CC22E|nr:hypothetical protein [Paraburkholderia nemoris]MBK3741188.1 hypothetical protein [Paraburkholderia aspalathi]